MKIVLDKTYVKYSIYTILTVTIIFILYGILSNLGHILKTALIVLGGVISVLTPLIIALVITYLFHPLVSRIEAFILMNVKLMAPKAEKNDQHGHLRRTISVLITYLLLLALIVLFIYSLYVLISGSLPRNIDLNSMLDSITNYTKSYNELFIRLTASMEKSGLSGEVKNQLLRLIQVSQNFTGNAIVGLFTSLQGFGNNLLNILLGFIIAFYLLMDFQYFKSLYRQSTAMLFKPQHNEKLSDFMADINGVVSSFIRGQLLVALIVGVFSSILLYIVGLDFAVLVGMTAGLFNVIPYFGPIIGSIIAVVVGLLSGSPLKALLAVAALVVVQQIDSNIISPRIVGNSVGLHPVFIILSIIIGGSCFGLLGMLIAVPVAGIIKLLLNRWVSFREPRQEK